MLSKCVPAAVMVWLVSALAAGEACAQVINVPPAGTFQMKPELAGKHPRLYFTSDDIPNIRSQGLGARNWFFTHAKGNYDSYKGQPAQLLLNWKDYLYGFWAQFYMVMAFLITQDQGYADTAKSWALFFAGNQSQWLIDDLSPMDITSGMAITYDVLYDQFTDSERAQLRAALFASADFIYPLFLVGSYWTSDFQNNHLHNRIHGLANAAFAIYGDDPALDVQKHADLAVGAIHQLVTWFPEDGSTHEGPGYWSFGRHWVDRTASLIEHVTGTDPTASNPNFGNDPYYRIYMTTPGWQRTFGIGDSGDGTPDNTECIALQAAKHQDPYQASVIRELMQVVPDSFYQHTSWGLLWYDGAMPDRPYSELPLWHFWPDLEMFSVRSSWDADATGLVFKCGPPGGHKMQTIRGDNGINIAHDHPDQNHFLLFAHGKFLAEDDGYPDQQKLTRSHNTLLFDGQGGPREATGWYQPFPYDQTATSDDVFLSQATAFATGNATPLYAAVSLAASRMIRHFLFIEGQYLMIVDETAANDGADHDFEWRLHKNGTWSQGDPGQFFVTDGDVRLDIRFLAPDTASLTSAFLPAELTAQPCLSVKAHAQQETFVSVLVPQQSQTPVVVSDLPAATNAVAVRGTQGQLVDLFGIAPSAGAFTMANAEAAGAAALIRRDGGALLLAFLVRGTSLKQGGSLTLSASQSANLAWRPDSQGGTLEVEAPYKTTGSATDVSIGGLSAGQNYHVAVDGQAAPDVQADASGIATLSVDLAARHTVVLGTGTVVQDGGQDAGQDASHADGGDHGQNDSSPSDGAFDAGSDPGSGSRLVGSCGCGAGPAFASMGLLAAALALLRRRRK